jgi:hypothetical protein
MMLLDFPVEKGFSVPNINNPLLCLLIQMQGTIFGCQLYNMVSEYYQIHWALCKLHDKNSLASFVQIFKYFVIVS